MFFYEYFGKNELTKNFLFENACLIQAHAKGYQKVKNTQFLSRFKSDFTKKSQRFFQ